MKIIDSKIVAKANFASFFSVSYVDRKGAEKKWHMVGRGEFPKCISGVHQQPDAAIIVPFHRREEKLVVIREFRIPVGDFEYGFPAGLLDMGEDLAETAARELKEETGLDLIRIYRHSPAVFSSAGITDETIAMVFAEVDGTPGTHHNHDSEAIEIMLMDREEIRKLLLRNDVIFGARAWLVMDAFVRLGNDYLF